MVRTQKLVGVTIQLLKLRLAIGHTKHTETTKSDGVRRCQTIIIWRMKAAMDGSFIVVVLASMIIAPLLTSNETEPRSKSHHIRKVQTSLRSNVPTKHSLTPLISTMHETASKSVVHACQSVPLKHIGKLYCQESTRISEIAKRYMV